jgi:hypothetical protein
MKGTRSIGTFRVASLTMEIAHVSSYYIILLLIRLVSWGLGLGPACLLLLLWWTLVQFNFSLFFLFFSALVELD